MQTIYVLISADVEWQPIVGVFTEEEQAIKTKETMDKLAYETDSYYKNHMSFDEFLERSLLVIEAWPIDRLVGCKYSRYWRVDISLETGEFTYAPNDVSTGFIDSFILRPYLQGFEAGVPTGIEVRSLVSIDDAKTMAKAYREQYLKNPLDLEPFRTKGNLWKSDDFAF